ncbi:MAG: hypothetical protein HZB50_08270 [Chloroflexi bacterium]|nr:hypothetical protein [Chloroflexota bacterium]
MEQGRIMCKRVVFNGIEISTSENDVSAKSFFDFTETIISLLESHLDGSDSNFHLSINTQFFTNKTPKHSIQLNGLKNQRTKRKVVKIFQRTAGMLNGYASGTARVSLLVNDR